MSNIQLNTRGGYHVNNKTRKLILEYRYALNNDNNYHYGKLLCVGINPINLEIVIRLSVGTSNIILFSIAEWSAFMHNTALIKKNLHIKRTRNRNIDVELLFQLDFHLFNKRGGTVLIVWLQNEFVLSKKIFANICNLNVHISGIIKYLQSLDFKTYYFNINNMALSMDGNLFDNIEQLINTPNDILNIAYKELLFLYPEFIRQDLLVNLCHLNFS